MASNTKVVLENTTDGYLAEGTSIKGGYFVIDALANISTNYPRIAVEGSLCYCQADDKLYMYDGSSWNEFEVGGGSSGITYDWNKEVAMGGSGYVQIGSFPMYDTNITIHIDATTTTTYHGTVIIATQNVSTSSMGSAHVINVYDDPSGNIANSIRVVYTSGSRNYDVYFVPAAWSKNIIHIQAVGLYSAPRESTICQAITSGSAPTTTEGLTINNILNNPLPLAGGTLTGTLTLAGTDVVLGTASSSSDDSGDIVFKYGNGQEKSRIWSDNTYSSGIGPNYRVYTDAGTQLYSGRLATLNDISQSNLTSQLGLGTLNNSAGWGTTTAGNGYTIRWGSDQPSGGGLIISEKGGQTFIQIDGEIYVSEGQKRLMHTDEFDSMMSTWISNHAYNGTYQ